MTLLPDAAHLMPPPGVGVDLAMLDASGLALPLVGSATIDDAVRGYGRTMLPRSAEMARTLEGGTRSMLDAPGPERAAGRSCPQQP